MKSISLRPTSTDDWEFCGVSADDSFVCIRLSLSQVLYLGEQCNRIVYAKFAGLKREKT